MDRILSLVTRRAGWMLALVAAATVLALLQLVDPLTGEMRLELDPSIDRMLPEGDEERVYYDYIRRLFGSDETIVVALVDDDVFTAENLRAIQRIAQRVELLDGVQRVVSLANALNIRSVDGDLLIEPFVDRVPEAPEELARIRGEALDNPIYAGNLVARNGGAAGILVYLQNIPERELLAMGIDEQIRRVADEERGEAEVWITGGTVVKAETGRMLVRDLSRTVPLAIAVCLVVSLLAFRSLPGILVPVLTTLLALVWTLGAVAAAGVSLNLVTALVPSLILVVGFAYAIHIVSEYHDELRTAPDEPEPVRAALDKVALPVALTGLTTAAGFLALTVSPIDAIREFGIIATLGVAFTVVASLGAAPAVLTLLPRPHVAATRGDTPFDRAMERLGRFDVRFRWPILGFAAVVALLSVWGTTRIRVSTEFFPPDGVLRENIDAVNQHLEGANTIYVVLETEYRDAFKEPVNLREIEELQGWLEAQPEIGGSTSLVDYLKIINRGFHDNEPQYLVIPDSRRLITQLFFFGANDELRSFVDSRYQTANIVLRTRVTESAETALLVERIEQRLAELPRHLHWRVTGNGVIVSKTIDDIARGQALSLSVAFLIIFAILAVLFTSPRVGFLALIPNALPVIVYFGVLGLTGVTLNTTTGLVACIVLGIAVDDTIHFLARFNSMARQRLDEERGIAEALRSVGRPVTITTIALCLGFLTLTTSELRNQVQFGALAAFTLAVAWLVDITFTPALAGRMRIVTLWDALSLDLGHDPHKAIPLFDGLRATQARVVAIMTSVRSFEKGEQIFEAGAEGGEMYVVIDGVMSASARAKDRVVKFGEMRRGDTVGEVALFYGRRTADVHAETDVRVLRLTRQNLERLRRRYPRIGAQIYANLSKILADRVASTTRSLS
ncbi:MAG: MMPL family transporter [Deltaproteobacteria bacterium]|nr:MMPL family transporter [Deltaproteobacteria bacterium]